MNKKTITFLIFLSFFVIYYAGSFSKISFGDCIGFVLDVEKRTFLPDFKPLTHFLYINTAIFCSKYLGMDSIFVMRMMSVLPAAMTVSLVFVLIKEFVKENWIAIISTLAFGFCFTFWRSAETVEVYTFNALWVILFLIFSIKALKSPSKNYIITAGLILGISLWVHIQNIMLIPAYLVLLYLKHDHKRIAISFIAFLLTVLLMFFVNYQQNIDFRYAFVSKKGPWVENTFEQGFMDLVKDVIKALAFLIYNFNIFLLFSFAGIIYLYKNFKTESFFLFTACLFTLGFATLYAVSDNYVFFIPFYIILTAFIALGIKKMSSKYALKKLMLTPLLIPLFYIFCLYVVSLTPKGKKFDEEKSYKDGLRYYMLPWLHNNIGCIEFTLDNGQTTDNVEALKESSSEFIELRKKYQTPEEIRKL
ncbi:protein O-mannosyl-transferase family [Epilithonimonas sp.]|uniref:protein O-mannosyl-transferase family n=1 Tax=Epilithonimonas sp. TaxID=2894511 RepID=UPI0035B4C6BE